MSTTDTNSRTPKTVWDLPRNDVRAALDFCESRDGKITPSERRTLLMLQDDPNELATALSKIISS